MELPPYHIPTMRGVISHTIERTWMYIRKAGTIILVVNIVLWALMYFPHEPIPKSEMEGLKAERQLAGSIAGRIGRGLEPVTRAAGFDWRTNISLIGGFAAKEVVVGTMGTVYSMSDTQPDEAEALSSRLSSDPHWSPLRAFAMMVFVMLYAPCLPTMAAIRRESGSWKWALFSTAYSTLIAFCLAVLIFQGGGMLGF
jgi:ferrous iron transport protein B